MNVDYLKFAGTLSFIASALHIAIIIGGPSWYRFFGAGESMASMAERVLITLVYLLRGACGLIAPFISNHPAITQNSTSFWVWSSIICLFIGLVHLKGVIAKWFM